MKYGVPGVLSWVCQELECSLDAWNDKWFSHRNSLVVQLRLSFNIKVSVVAACKKYCLLVCDAVLFGSKLPIFLPDCTSSTLEDSVIQHRRQYSVHFSCYFSSAQLSKSVTATKPHRRCKVVLCGQQANITKSIIRTSFQFPPLPPSHTASGFIFNKIKPLQNSSCFCTKTFMIWRL